MVQNGVRKGAWTQQEDDKLRAYVEQYGHSNWRLLPKFADLDRCGKSCRLRWMNYLKPGLTRGGFSQQERDLIRKLHQQYGNKWSVIAAKLPGRTDNGVKNYWHAYLKNRAITESGKEAEIRDGSSSVIKSKLMHIKPRVSSSSKVFILESSDPNLTAIPTVMELGSDSSVEQRCSNMSSVTSIDADNFSDLVVSGFHDDFWTQPFIVESDCNVRVCDEGFIFPPLVGPWMNDLL